jgi:hypothetical protein
MNARASGSENAPESSIYPPRSIPIRAEKRPLQGILGGSPGGFGSGSGLEPASFPSAHHVDYKRIETTVRTDIRNLWRRVAIFDAEEIADAATLAPLFIFQLPQTIFDPTHDALSSNLSIRSSSTSASCHLRSISNALSRAFRATVATATSLRSALPASTSSASC